MHCVSVSGLTTPGSRAAHGVDALDEVPISDEVEHTRGHARHDPHAQQYVVRVGQLDAVLAERGAEGTHAEGEHVHHATCNSVNSSVTPVTCTVVLGEMSKSYSRHCTVVTLQLGRQCSHHSRHFKAKIKDVQM